MTTEALVSTEALRSERARVLTAAAVAALAGVLLVFAVGFADPEIIHAAAHDGRHSLSFPCH